MSNWFNSEVKWDKGVGPFVVGNVGGNLFNDHFKGAFEGKREWNFMLRAKRFFELSGNGNMVKPLHGS